jgi:hypothetical protein
VGRLVDFPVPLCIEHDLRDARSVAKIDEHHHPVVAPPLHPALQDHGLAHMRFVQLSASVGSLFHVTLAFFTDDEKALQLRSRIA